MTKKSTPKKKDKVTEIFEVKEEGKEKIVKTEGVVETPVVNKGQEKHQAKVLKILLISCLAIIALVLGSYYYLDSLRYSSYDGVEFTTISEGNLIFYRTSIPVMYGGKEVPYNFYLRTKPKDLSRVDFENSENYDIMRYNFLEFKGEFNCDGNGVIAIQNMRNLFTQIGSQGLIVSNQTCDNSDEEKLYNYFIFEYGDKTQIEEFQNGCYKVTVKGNEDFCEILPATEKIMAETFVKFNKL